MTPEAQRIAIAEACGIWKLSSGAWLGPGCNHLPGPPDYLSDLNAMHEAEKMLTYEEQGLYWNCLESTIWNPVLAEHPDSKVTVENTRLILLFSTAAQRAEAFLRTIGKWKE